MKRILFIGLALFIVVYQSVSQEWDTELSIFESFLEEERFADQTNAFNLLQAIHAEDEEGILDRYEKLIEKLDKKSSKKAHVKWFLEELFYKSHQYILKDYRKHSTFNEMLANGSYDCVSGSALLGLLLERYGFDFEVIETDYHVFVLVHDGENTYVMESTEAREGFMTDPKVVAAYIAAFKPTNLRPGNFKSLAGQKEELIGGENTIYRSISLKELAGLQYYNDAVHHFNENEMELVQRQLIKAAKIYPSERVEAFYDYVQSQNNDSKKLARR